MRIAVCGLPVAHAHMRACACMFAGGQRARAAAAHVAAGGATAADARALHAAAATSPRRPHSRVRAPVRAGARGRAHVGGRRSGLPAGSARRHAVQLTGEVRGTHVSGGRSAGGTPQGGEGRVAVLVVNSMVVIHRPKQSVV